MMGLFKRVGKVVDLVDKGLDLADQVIVDKDKREELKTQLLLKRAEYLLTGSGSSITKVTISALVSLLVVIGCYTYLVRPENIPLYKDLTLAVSPLLGLLIGVYGTAKTVQRVRNGRKDRQ